MASVLGCAVYTQLSLVQLGTCTCVLPKVAATVDSGIMSTVSSSKYSQVLLLFIKLT
jgi:hypothetical protein